MEFSLDHLPANVGDRRRHLPIMLGRSKRELMWPTLVNALAPSASLMQLFLINFHFTLNTDIASEEDREFIF